MSDKKMSVAEAWNRWIAERPQVVNTTDLRVAFMAGATLTAATSGGVDEVMVERAITAAMKRSREEGVGLCDRRWDTLFPSRAAWRAALAAALKDEGG